MAYSVSQRTQEIGVRMVMGATPGSVFRGVFSHGLRLVAAGVVVGIVAAGVLTRILKALLYQTDALDPWAFGAATLLLLVVAALATYLPARRSTRVAPVLALRAE